MRCFTIAQSRRLALTGIGLALPLLAAAASAAATADAASTSAFAARSPGHLAGSVSVAQTPAPSGVTPGAVAEPSDAPSPDTRPAAADADATPADPASDSGAPANAPAEPAAPAAGAAPEGAAQNASASGDTAPETAASGDAASPGETSEAAPAANAAPEGATPDLSASDDAASAGAPATAEAEGDGAGDGTEAASRREPDLEEPAAGMLGIRPEAVPTPPADGMLGITPGERLAIQPDMSVTLLTGRQLDVGVLDDQPGFSARGRFGLREGFDVDVARALCRRLGARCRLVPLAADDIVPALMEDRIDLAVASQSATAALQRLVAVSDPYVQIAVRFVGREGTSVDLEPSRETPTTIGSIAGTAPADYLRGQRSSGLRLRPYTLPEEMWVDLAMGRLDAVLASTIFARRTFLETPLGQGFTFVSGPVEETATLGRGAVITTRSGDDDTLNAVNAALRDLLSSPDYVRFIARHLDPKLASRPRPAMP